LLDRKLGYRELAENPFFLKLIATYWREKQTLPENQTVLFQEFSRFLLREYRSNLQGFENLEGLSNETVESLLAHVGFAMTAHFKSIVADYDALVNYLTASSQAAQAGFNHQKIEAVLKVAIGSRLIFRDKQNRLRFQHHRFQEYFAAYYIKVFKPALNWEQLYDNIWWQEVLVLLFGISEEPNELMLGLLDSIPTLDPDNPPTEFRQEDIAERLILAARCQGNALTFLNDELINRLMHQINFYMRKGERLIVIKMIEALGYTKGKSILPFMEFLIMHESPWVQDEAIELIMRH